MTRLRATTTPKELEAMVIEDWEFPRYDEFSLSISDAAEELAEEWRKKVDGLLEDGRKLMQGLVEDALRYAVKDGVYVDMTHITAKSPDPLSLAIIIPIANEGYEPKWRVSFTDVVRGTMRVWEPDGPEDVAAFCNDWRHVAEALRSLASEIDEHVKELAGEGKA